MEAPPDAAPTAEGKHQKPHSPTVHLTPHSPTVHGGAISTGRFPRIMPLPTVPIPAHQKVHLGTLSTSFRLPPTTRTLCAVVTLTVNSNSPFTSSRTKEDDSSIRLVWLNQRHIMHPHMFWQLESRSCFARTIAVTANGPINVQ
jgi:hypothetical protein